MTCWKKEVFKKINYVHSGGWIITNGIGRIGYDYIVVLDVFFHELETVGYVQVKFGAVEPLGHERQVLFGKFHHAIVDLHLVNGLHQRVFGYFSGHSSVATANDEHL